MTVALPSRRRLRSLATGLAVVLMAAAVPVALNVADAATDFNCSGGYQVDETLQNGARWQLCWERRAREGIVLHDVTYTPIGGSSIEVLGQANLAQIHVPYHDNQARFHDLSDFGLGTDEFMNNLQPEDCPNGERLVDDARNVLCMTESPTGYAYKDYGEQAQGTSLNLFSVSHIGAYNYIVAWNLDDDGTIRPEVGATGRLQAIVRGTANSTGWPIGGNRTAVAHLHNYTWRLDFDVAGSSRDDRVEELEAPSAANGTQRRVIRRLFANETARRVAPDRLRSWRVRDTVVRNADGHPISFEILPEPDSIFRGPAYEPWTQNDFYVTRHRACERFASHNPGGGGCQGASPNNQLAAFVNGQSLSDQDVVVWYSASFNHLPRDEDENHMHPHWTGFSIIPRDLTGTNPAG